MKRILLILAACACACAWAGVMSARLGALGRNDAVVTNVTDVTPGNYETVSNRAMAASNYTDTVAEDIRQNYIPISGGPIISSVELSLNNLLYEQRMIQFELPDGTSADAQSFVGSSQITNQGAVAVATALAARKQDQLPYPTNAIPYAAISGAPSGGGQEWRVVDVHSFYGDTLSYVTNGMTRLYLGDYVMLSTNGWPEGAAMYVQGIKEFYAWYPAAEMRLVGYGTWPTNNFQSVWWRSGTNIYVNVILEE